MINRHSRFCGLRLRTLAASAFLSAATFSSFAQTPLEMPQRLDRFHIWVNGNIVTNKYASEAEEYGIRMAQNARIYGRAETGGVGLSKQLAINTKNGIVVAEAKQLLNARSIAKGIASVATGGGALGLAVLAAPHVYQYLKDGGFDVENGQVMKPAADPGGYLDDQEYSVTPSGPWYPDWYGPCLQVMPQYAQNVIAGWPQDSYLYYCQYTMGPPYSPGTVISAQIYRRKQASPPPPLPPQPVTAQEIEDALATKNPTPEVLKELAEKGGHAPKPDPSNPPKIENPQPSQEKTTTKTNPDGSSETTTCRTNGTVQGNTLKLTESCTITKKDPQGNTTGTTTTNSDDADPVQPKEDYSFSDQPLPAHPVLYERKYPDGLVGVWNSKKAELDTAPLVQLVSQLMPDVSSVGTCPNWSLDLDMGVANMGVWDVSPPCYVWDFAKVVIICSALLLARALVFGG